MLTEQERLQNDAWRKWGPYLTDRQWGTVREDYSIHGDAWEYTTHDMARSKCYRWGEEGIAGISDDQQLLCFAVALWNKKDPILKERLFGLTNREGNHGEDVKELYYYLDATPSHSYLKMLYKYPQKEYPYAQLIEENIRRTRLDPEYELLDTGIFDDNEYFDVFIEYAKADVNDILIKITIYNRSQQEASLHVLPTVWFRNTWAWGYDSYKPLLLADNKKNIFIDHKKLGNYTLYQEADAPLLFCDNETNLQRLYNVTNTSQYVKDGINNYIIHDNVNAINHTFGTKASVNHEITVKGGEQQVIRLRLTNVDVIDPFNGFDAIMQNKIHEADEFYQKIQEGIVSEDAKMVQRQALAGMVWNKQFYYYDVYQWLKGDPAQPKPPAQRKHGRNHEWKHLNNADIISMPDKWEYPWYAAWDLCFHCVPLAMIDSAFAKQQLLLLTKEWYMHPNGQLPAYEWSFCDANPPVHALAAWHVYRIDQQNNNGKGDLQFLESIFHKLLLSFTWWVNRKDHQGNNIFEGGFLGLDNIGAFDRSAALPTGGFIEQADATSWMAMYSLNLMRIALELALSNPVYQDMATKFFEHFLYIAGAMDNIGGTRDGLWDEDDQFFYDVLMLPNENSCRIKLRSLVGLMPLFAVEILDHEILEKVPQFARRARWFLNYRPDLSNLVSRWEVENKVRKHLLSLLRSHRMKAILRRMLDETEFLSAYGIRSLSKHHEKTPYQFHVNGDTLSVAYTPAEASSSIFGGNSNWRGPIWMPVNYLIIESLRRFHYFYGNDYRVEYPTGSQQYLTLGEIADELSQRLSSLFLLDGEGRRPVFGQYEKLQNDPHFRNYILFYEYFDGDNGRGAGASHQTGWTGLVAKLLQPKVDLVRALDERKEVSNFVGKQ
ncbi:glucosidase [Chitinophagaceae bacterium LB-8]|uniref:Glucosidase n=1 Tax=Paraflavisolibacter caeni TaxID=2982496 RepID=A0A9X3BFC7_9BACT|nr:glucosidase [Paraflavisolibacter caeni]MCU7548559.1 glucosidase [Paraflavisolibacter caeni]